jgi:retron-type reverse transcriptase
MIAVASIKDRFVHRFLYDDLVERYDKTFLYDVWSCREGKGLKGAIERAQEFLRKHRGGYFWRADIRKFFDSVDQDVLLSILKKNVHDPITMRLLRKVIESYRTNFSNERELLESP